MPPYFKGSTTSRYRRTYTWNERNQLISSVDANYSTAYVYGQDGQRSNKYTGNSETLYFNKMWTHHTDSGNNVYGGQTAKNIYLGETRIVTKLNSGNEPKYQEEYYKQYYYHSDHLGSASMISDYKGDEYQRIEYTPYGETWVEKTSNTGLEYLPYKFTAKELDEETGLYYYGARYLDPKYSMWLSTDPALGEYIPQAPVNDEARNYNQNLPGLGGIFNTVNLNLYHYAANNPVRYVDPDGRFLASYYANSRFNISFKWYRDKYKENLDLINQYDRFYGTFTKTPSNTTVEDTIAHDEIQAKTFIPQEAGKYAIQMGYKRGSEEYNNYVNKEKELYSKIQQLRKQKHQDGTYKIYIAEDMLKEACNIYNKRYAEELAGGLSKAEAMIKADKAADNYMYKVLEENGL